MEKVCLVQVSQLGKFLLSDIVHHKDIFQLPRSMSDVIGVWLQKLQVHKRVPSISNKGSRGEESLGESGECQKEKLKTGRSRAK